MGTLIAEALAADGGFLVAGTYDIDNINELDEMAGDSDLVIDFSNKAALPHVLAYVQRTGAALVSGTTGFSEAEQAQIRALGAVAPVIWSGNYSLGVAALRHATELVAAAVDWDVEIVETHHNQKVDAPSGTAKMLLKAVDPDDSFDHVYGREGIPGARGHEIGIHALRGGTVAGEHSVFFFGEDETLEFRHSAASRKIFAVGALKAARFAAQRENGLYGMEDILF